MSEKVSADVFSDAVQTVLLKFAEDTADLVQHTAAGVGEDTVKILRDTSPKNSGLYAKEWRLKKAKNGRNGTKITVYNRSRYQLTHLLEKGHAKIDGGRTNEYPHIKPAEEYAAKEFGERIMLEVGKNK